MQEPVGVFPDKRKAVAGLLRDRGINLDYYMLKQLRALRPTVDDPSMPENVYAAFISYRQSEGGAEARLIRAALAEHGLTAFLDVTDLGSGHFDEALLQCIADTPIFIAVLSPSALDRCIENKEDWMRREIAHAILTRRTIVPVILPEFKWPTQLPDDIRDLPRHNGVKYSHDFFDAVIDKILRLVGSQTIEERTSAIQPPDRVSATGLAEGPTETPIPGEITSRISRRLLRGPSADDVPVAPNAGMRDAESKGRAAELIAQYRKAYASGRIVESLNCIAKAYQLTPNDTIVVSRYAMALMRVGREKAVTELLDRAKENGKYDDPIKGIEAEHLRRQGKPEIALGVLETVQNPDYYNIAYEKGMCNLVLYSQRRRTSCLLQALAYLRDARRSHPQHWWVTTNLAITARVIGKQDDEVERAAIAQLEEAIQRNPLKASVRVYRLLYYVMIQDMERLAATIASDHENCPSTMEVACDFFDTVQERIALICPDEKQAGLFMQMLKRWPLPFTLLHT